MESEDAIALGVPRYPAEGVPRRTFDLGPPRPVQGRGSLANLHMLPKGTVQHADAIDREALGRNVMAQMREHVERPLRTRDRIGDDRFFHMYYSEMMRDPMGVMRRIYDWAGDDLTVDTEDRMQRGCPIIRRPDSARTTTLSTNTGCQLPNSSRSSPIPVGIRHRTRIKERLIAATGGKSHLDTTSPFDGTNQSGLGTRNGDKAYRQD